jgi:transposase
MKTTKRFTDEYRMLIIQDYLSSGASKNAIRKKYNLSGVGAISQWMRTFGIEDPKTYSIPIGFMPQKKSDESSEIVELKRQIDQLKASNVYFKMKNEALEMMIDLAEKELQIPIRKKSGTKQ